MHTITTPQNKNSVLPFKFEWPQMLGLTLLVLYMLQYQFELSPSWLVDLYQNNIYRQITGFLLLFYLLRQWRLAKARATNPIDRGMLRRQHQYNGLLAPIVVCAHSLSLGYGYQELLMLAFLSNYLVGLCNPDVCRLKIRCYYAVWLLLHISLSVLISALLVYHLYVIYFY